MSTYGTPYVYHESLSSACWAELPADKAIECPDCSFRCSVDHLDVLDRAWERVQPGDTMPDGQCPECGAACYVEDEPEPVIFVDAKADAARAMLAALGDLRKQLRAHVKMDVRKHYSLMVADVAADKAILQAEAAGIVVTP